jgi:hypothetical protein
VLGQQQEYCLPLLLQAGHFWTSSMLMRVVKNQEYVRDFNPLFALQVQSMLLSRADSGAPLRITFVHMRVGHEPSSAAGHADAQSYNSLLHSALCHHRIVCRAKSDTPSVSLSLH